MLVFRFLLGLCLASGFGVSLFANAASDGSNTYDAKIEKVSKEAAANLESAIAGVNKSIASMQTNIESSIKSINTKIQSINTESANQLKSASDGLTQKINDIDQSYN